MVLQKRRRKERRTRVPRWRRHPLRASPSRERAWYGRDGGRKGRRREKGRFSMTRWVIGFHITRIARHRMWNSDPNTWISNSLVSRWKNTCNRKSIRMFARWSIQVYTHSHTHTVTEGQVSQTAAAGRPRHSVQWSLQLHQRGIHCHPRPDDVPGPLCRPLHLGHQ